MSHSSTLIGEITERCKDKYDYENADNWKSLWLKEAKAWRDECQSEGLAETVKALDKCIEFFEKG